MQGSLPDTDAESEKVLRGVKSRAVYGAVQTKVDKVKSMPSHQVASSNNDTATGQEKNGGTVAVYQPPNMMAGAVAGGVNGASTALSVGGGLGGTGAQTSHQLAIRKAAGMPKPAWHAPWKLYRVISGHMGWVRCVTVEPGNEWFATGAADRVIKIWDLVSGRSWGKKTYIKIQEIFTFKLQDK